MNFRFSLMKFYHIECYYWHHPAKQKHWKEMKSHFEISQFKSCSQFKWKALT